MRLNQRLLLVLLMLCTSVSWGLESGPRIFLLAQNAGTEITDLFVPFALLSAAGAKVEIVATQAGPVNLMNGFELLDRRSLDQVQPAAADLVIVPAVHHVDQQLLLDWLTAAHASGATIASICDGVSVLAATGLLEGRRATGHFYSESSRRKKHPNVLWQDNVRYVEDGRVFSTSGISASAPASIRLIERFVGVEQAQSVALTYGIAYPAVAQHDSSQFSVRWRELSTGVMNWLMGLRKRQYNLETKGLVDEYALGLTVDSLGRTFRAAIGVNASDSIIRTSQGLRIRGKRAFAAPDWQLRFDTVATDTKNEPPTITLDSSPELVAMLLQHIRQEYGAATADLVGLQLELPNRGAGLYN